MFKVGDKVRCLVEKNGITKENEICEIVEIKIIEGYEFLILRGYEFFNFEPRYFELAKNEFKLNYIDLDVTVAAQVEKLREETSEVMDALLNNDKENILEESMDVIQVVLGIIQTCKLQKEFLEYNSKHQEKLRGRGHILTNIRDVM